MRNAGGSPGSNDSQEPIEFVKVKSALGITSYAVLRKINASTVLEGGTGIGPLVEAINQGHIFRGSRIAAHLWRLLEREGVERQFAELYLQCLPEIQVRMSDVWEKVFGVMNSESKDTPLFWTFAPYLLAEMKRRGISDTEAMEKIFTWGSKGRGFEGGSGVNDQSSNIPGLAEYGKTEWTLSDNPSHVTHRFTAQEAPRIVDLIMASGK